MVNQLAAWVSRNASNPRTTDACEEPTQKRPGFLENRAPVGIHHRCLKAGATRRCVESTRTGVDALRVCCA
jgi:hypothetical protein